MAKKKTLVAKDADQLVKSMLVVARSIQQILEAGAVEKAMSKRLSPSKVQVLRLLGVCGDQTPSQVARFLGVSKPAVTQIVDSMVREKMVTRKTAERSRREVTLKLSAIGVRRFRAVADQQRNLVKAAARKSSATDVHRWSDTLWKISQALAAADDTTDHVCLQCEAHADPTCALDGCAANCRFIMQEDAPKRTAQQSSRKKKAPARRKK